MEVDTFHSISKNIEIIRDTQLFTDQRPAEGPGAAIDLDILFDQKNLDAGAFPLKQQELPQIRKLV